MQIRPAHPADAATVNELMHQLGYPQDDTAATEARIRAWGDDTASATYVVDVDGSVLGLIAVHVCPYFERSGRWARIVALVVSDRARGKGLGGKLLAAAESFAKSQGCERMEVTSSDRRQDAHRFYQGHGFTNQTGRSSRFLRDLNGDRHEDREPPKA